MPSSNLAIALEVLALVDQVPHGRVLDVGPGYGKYGLLLHEYLNNKPVEVRAVEAEPSYLVGHRLDRHPWYSDVVVGDVCDLSDSVLGWADVVLMVDVIEHIVKDRALLLLGRIPGRVVIATPINFFEQHVAGVPSEDHVSHWVPADFDASRVEVCYESLGGLLVRLGPQPNFLGEPE